MKLPKLRGDFWAIVPQEIGIVRLEFRYKRGRLYMNVWEDNLLKEADWGPTPCFRLVDPTAKRGVRSYFASWEAEDCMIHCLIQLQGDEMQVQWIGLFPDGKGYRELGYFTKDASRVPNSNARDPIAKFKNMWDGSEPGWKLCTCEAPTFVVELQFENEDGATAEQVAVVSEWIHRIDGDTDETMVERLRGCTGIPVPNVLSGEQLESLRQLTVDNNIGMTVQEIPSGHLSPMNPEGREMVGLWLLAPDIVEKLTRKMLEEGIPVVERVPQ
jgi:hypothetical protein